MNKLVILTIVILIILIVIVIIYKLLNKRFNEKYGYYCKNCNRNDWMGESDCASCLNCGWCINPDGHGSCGVGTFQGPLFKDCRSWYYQGRCMWGPECDYSGPIYTVQTPFYYHWFNWNNWPYLRRWRYWGNKNRFNNRLRRGLRRRRFLNNRRNPVNRRNRRNRKNRNN